MTNEIAASGLPLAFKMAHGNRPSLLGAGTGKALYKVETRMLSGHQKEAVVEEGEGGQKWRLTSDEGVHLKGDDEAPPPLGFFNAGILGDVLSRLRALPDDSGTEMPIIEGLLKNYYWFEGSFAKGTGKGQADTSEMAIRGVDGMSIKRVETAMRCSPAIYALENVVPATFALYVNGSRKTLSTIPASAEPDADDPYLVHATPPAPLDASVFKPMTKPGIVQEGEPEPFPDTIGGRLLRRIAGRSELGDSGLCLTDAWVDLPGMSHFLMNSDDRPSDNIAPSSLSYFAAGVAFCFMTQLSRYMMAMKLDTGHLRMVQNWAFEVDRTHRGIAHPVDTHLFLNGAADAETHEMLVRVAANTCYLHAALKTALKPNLVLNP